MAKNGSLMAGDDEEFIKGVMKIMIVWTIVVILAGFLLVALQGPFSAIFTFAGVF